MARVRAIWNSDVTMRSCFQSGRASACMTRAKYALPIVSSLSVKRARQWRHTQPCTPEAHTFLRGDRGGSDGKRTTLDVDIGCTHTESYQLSSHQRRLWHCVAGGIDPLGLVCRPTAVAYDGCTRLTVELLSATQPPQDRLVRCAVFINSACQHDEDIIRGHRRGMRPAQNKQARKNDREDGGACSHRGPRASAVGPHWVACEQKTRA